MNFFKRTMAGVAAGVMLACAVGVAAQAAPDDVVAIPDANLRECVNTAINEAGIAIDQAADADVTEAQMSRLTHLICASQEIADITGLQHATSLHYLSLYDNQITDVSPLAGLPNLRDVTLTNNQVADVSPLVGLTNLKSLGLGHNQVADVSALAGLTNLEYLSVHFNQVADVSPLAGLTNLKSMGLSGNQITDVSPLAGLIDLESLYLDSNQVADISPLAGLTNLWILWLHENQVVDVAPLAGLTNLQYLFLTQNQILDASPLAGLTNLTSFDLSGQTSALPDVEVGVPVGNPLRGPDSAVVSPVVSDTDTSLCVDAGCAELVYPAAGINVYAHWDTEITVGAATTIFSGSLLRDVLAAPVGPTAADASAKINPQQTATLSPEVTPGNSDLVSALFENGSDTLTVDDQGTWTVQLADGQPEAKFVPEAAFRGTATPATYVVTDANDLTASGTLHVLVNTGPTVADASAKINPQQTATLSPEVTLGNSDLVSALFENGSDTLTVDGQGTWTVQLADGQPEAKFVPEAAFRGTATAATYVVTDANDLTASGTLTVTVAQNGTNRPQNGTSSTGGALPMTGGDLPWMIVPAAVALVGAGAILLWLRPRRREEQNRA